MMNAAAVNLKPEAKNAKRGASASRRPKKKGRQEALSLWERAG
jgi:hypothetical protein